MAKKRNQYKEPIIKGVLVAWYLETGIEVVRPPWWWAFCLPQGYLLFKKTAVIILRNRSTDLIFWYMFTKKEDRHPVEIRVNLDIEKIKKKYPESEIQTTKEGSEKSYQVTIFPLGNYSEYYFHHKTFSFTQGLGFYDCLGKTTVKLRINHGDLLILINEKVVFFCPVDFAVLIQNTGNQARHKKQTDLLNPFTEKLVKKYGEGDSEITTTLTTHGRGEATYTGDLASVSFFAMDNIAFYNQ